MGREKTRTSYIQHFNVMQYHKSNIESPKIIYQRATCCPKMCKDDSKVAEQAMMIEMVEMLYDQDWLQKDSALEPTHSPLKRPYFSLGALLVAVC